MEYLYPGGLAKAITFSYDDGQPTGIQVFHRVRFLII